MKIPHGWKLVPAQMTPAMYLASKWALKKYMQTVPANLRLFFKCKRHGMQISTELKHNLRYEAAINAAPLPPVILPEYQEQATTDGTSISGADVNILLFALDFSLAAGTYHHRFTREELTALRDVLFRHAHPP